MQESVTLVVIAGFEAAQTLTGSPMTTVKNNGIF